MKKLSWILSMSFIVMSFVTLAQYVPRIEETPEPIMEVNIPVPDSMQIIDFPDSAAEFPGGEKEVMKFIPDRLQIPDSLNLYELQGRVFVRFVIERDGSVSSPEILRGIHPIIDKEIIRIVKTMPKWKPAYYRGNPVRSRYIIPIRIHFQ